MQLGGFLGSENKFRAYSSLLQQKTITNKILKFVNVEFTVLCYSIPGHVVEIIAACTTFVDKR